MDLDHFRDIYSWSSHFVHADAKALNLSRIERGGSSAVLTNSTNIMLADPGQCRRIMSRESVIDRRT